MPLVLHHSSITRVSGALCWEPRRRPMYILYKLTVTHLLDWLQLETDRTPRERGCGEAAALVTAGGNAEWHSAFGKA